MNIIDHGLEHRLVYRFLTPFVLIQLLFRYNTWIYTYYDVNKMSMRFYSILLKLKSVIHVFVI